MVKRTQTERILTMTIMDLRKGHRFATAVLNLRFSGKTSSTSNKFSGQDLSSSDNCGFNWTFQRQMWLPGLRCNRNSTTHILCLSSLTLWWAISTLSSLCQAADGSFLEDRKAALASYLVTKKKLSNPILQHLIEYSQVKFRSKTPHIKCYKKLTPIRNKFWCLTALAT